MHTHTMKSKSTKVAVTRLRSAPPGSVSTHIYVRHALPAKGKGPVRLITYLLQPTSVPHIQKVDTKRTKVDGEETVALTPIELPSGGSTVFMSVFADIPPVGFYQVNGLFYDTWAGSTELMTSFNVANVFEIPVSKGIALAREIPIENRSIGPNDIPTLDNRGTYSDDQERRIVLIDVSPTPTEGDGIWGLFSPLDDPSKSVTSYTSKDGRLVTAMTGGPGEGQAMGPADAQLTVTQSIDGVITRILILTKIYDEGGLRRLGTTKWDAFGNILGHQNLRGLILGTINRQDSAKVSTSDASLAGVVAIGSAFYPNLDEMAPALGFKLTWDACVKLDPRLATPAAMVIPDLPDYNGATVINILEYTGDVSLVPDAAALGWVALYALTNLGMSDAKRATLRNAPEADILARLMDEDEYPNGRHTIIWVVLTESGRALGATVKDFISTGKKPPTGRRFFADSV